jgi:peptidoglycan/LPS O-acetylase OafA/YrhL
MATSERLRGVEAGRGIAACLVVFFHVGEYLAKHAGITPLGGAFGFGRAGVDFFFVLSGFIILLVHRNDIGRPGRAGRYIARRATRIYPLYWVVLAVMLGHIAASSHHAWPGAAVLATDVLLLPSAAPTVGVAWTLQFELVFYAAFLVLVLHRGTGIVLFVAWAGLIAAFFAWPGWSGSWLLAFLGSPFCTLFFLGMAAAVASRGWRVPRPGLLLTVGICAFLAVGLAENAGQIDGQSAFARLGYGVPAALALVGVVALERAGRLRLPKAAVAIGSGSYAIYLMHFPIIGITWKVLSRLDVTAALPPAAMFVILATAGIAGGVVGSRFVEFPVMRIFRERLATVGSLQMRPAPP